MIDRKPIGQSLIDANLITATQLERALDHQKSMPDRGPLGEIVVELGFLKDEDFASFLASYLDFSFLNLDKLGNISPEAVSLISSRLAHRHNIFPIRKEKQTIYIAMSDPLDFTTLDSVSKITRCRTRAVVCTKSQIKEYIKQYYDDEIGPQEKAPDEVIPDQANLSFATSFVDLLIEKAYRHSARAVHIQPEEGNFTVFLRIDEGLQLVESRSKNILPSVVVRIKHLASLNISSKDTLQDGAFEVRLIDQEIALNIEVSILPTVWGERIVLTLPH